MPLDFRALLAAHQPPIDPATVPVLALRHAPPERGLRKVFPRLAADSPVVFNAYQQAQPTRVANQMLAATYVASFIALPREAALFIGLYERLGQQIMTADEINAIPEVQALLRHGLPPATEPCYWFNLQLRDDFFGQWKGKLQIDWPSPPIVRSRWVNDESFFDVTTIHSESQLDERPKDSYREWDLRYDEPADLPESWWIKLESWRAIYYIFDTSDGGRGYVGSARGQRNLRQRWGNYRDNGHAGNVELMGRTYANFRFSILELVQGNMEDVDLLPREQNWMIRLRTRTRPFGLNLPVLADGQDPAIP